MSSRPDKIPKELWERIMDGTGLEKFRVRVVFAAYELEEDSGFTKDGPALGYYKDVFEAERATRLMAAEKGCRCQMETRLAITDGSITYVVLSLGQLVELR